MYVVTMLVVVVVVTTTKTMTKIGLSGTKITMISV
jgi:hypothetical protein